MTFTAEGLEALLLAELGGYVWPFFRVAGLVMVAPVFGTRLVPIRVKIALGAALTVVLAPTLDPPPLAVSLGTGLVVVHEILLGAMIGFVLQMLFDALVIAGQTIAMTMGLGFATMVDPQRGVSVPLLAQFFVILGILVFLTLDGHLALLALLAESFELIPIGAPLGRDSVWGLLAEGGEMFAGALRIALPAVTALLVVNLAFGVMSRAAPTLNLFAVGFPISLLAGLVIMYLTLPGVMAAFSQSLEAAFGVIRTLLAITP